ncbi:MAG: TAT-variant-translocated molybdopterin oxidoreductase [Verrucomicrobiota bacterium]|nr:TAT-variant-translocated molybdopterin oxidoreductase [Verrucomicrobiota bacterium]
MDITQGKQYWKSLDDLADTPGFRKWVEREFPEGASLIDGVQRRGFLKVMAASFGLAGLGMTGCRRPEHAILPHGKSPEELIPGIPAFYSSARPTSGGFIPLIVESHEGRPTKIEGNPSFIKGGGSTDIYSQASVLDLYDPDRARGCFGKESSSNDNESSTRWKKVQSTQIKEKITDLDKLGNVAILADSSFSSIRNFQFEQLSSKGVKIYTYDPVDFKSPEKAMGRALGSENSLRACPDFSKAKRVLALDSDFLGHREPNSSVNTKQFMPGRKVLSAKDTKKMNRLYSVESDLSITGGVADHRLRLSSIEIEAFAALVLHKLLVSTGNKNAKLIEHLSVLSKSVESHSDWAGECVADLLSKPKESLVVSGCHLPGSVHLLTYKINQVLGNESSSLKYIKTESSLGNINSLQDSITKKEVETLIIVGGNPVYHCPSIGWDNLFNEVKTSFRLGHSIDETSQLCDYHIGQSHYLECWDIGTNWTEDTYCPVQPLLAPLFDTMSDLEMFSCLLGEEKKSHDLFREFFDSHSELKGNFDGFLKLGVANASPRILADLPSADQAILKIEKDDFNLSGSSLEVLLVPDFHTWDGQFSNNGWMMECPHPITKLTWDNALLISPVLAKQLEKQYPDLGLLPKATMLNKNGEIAPDAAVFLDGKQKAPMVKLTVGDHHEITVPLYVQPGLADFTVISTIGQGRSRVGRVGSGTGFNTCSLMHTDANRVITGAQIQPTTEFYTLANVQEHWSMEGRAIVRETNAKYYSEHEDFAQKMGSESHSPPMWGKDQNASIAVKSTSTPRGNSAYEHPDHTYEHSDTFGRHQWGMSIDLNQCTGCSACVVACQSENNIPVVGKDQVLRGREMHWIRLDRYFSSPEREGAELPSDVQVSFQGVACMHCETAPCESVCPVNATVHDEEGLNAMAYNRCVGTRYCANNCPYKVRRFNFFDWNKRKTEQLYEGPLGEENDSLTDMGKNPDVTVRMRGVMEKCTYCVQRIQESKIRVKVNAQKAAKLASGKDGADMNLDPNDLKVPDGMIRTACQQACPSDSIVFGDLSDPESEVSKLKNNPRDYSVLGYLNTRPRTTFLAKVRNPNPKMPDYTKKPHSYREYSDKAYPADQGKSKKGKIAY